MAAIANLTTYISGENAAFLNTIEQTRGGLRSLIASLDPVAAATARYNKQVDLLDKALRTNRLTVEQHATLTQRLGARYEEQIRGQQALTGQTGQMRAGFQQLSFQMGDVATQFASGTGAMQIFAQQGSQVLMAIGMMQREAKGFIGFMAGPWGQVILAATMIISTLTSKLLDNAEASKTAELANDGLSEAQSALGKMFDLTSGKLERQNELLRLNAMLTAQNLKVEAAAAKARVESAAQSAKLSTMDKILAYAARQGAMVAGAEQAGQRVSGTLQGVLSGRVSADAAFKSVAKGDLGILGISQQDFNTALRDAVESRFKSQTADEITKSLESGVLSPSLRNPEKPRTPRDTSSQQLERYQNEIARMQDEQLSLQAQLTTDLHQRALIEDQRLEAEAEAYKKDLAVRVQQKEITQAQADSLRLAHEANQQKKQTLINWRLDEEMGRQELEIARADVDLANQALSGNLDAARTQQERRRIQLEMLENEFKLLRLSAEEVLASKFATDAEKEIARRRLARLDELKSLRTESIERQTAGPMANYLDSLPKSADEFNEALQRVSVDGLQDLKDGLKGVLLEGENVFDALGNAADRFMSKLLDMAMDQAIASLFGGGGGGGFNLFGLFGGGGGKSVAAAVDPNLFRHGIKLPGFAKGGEFKVGGLAGVDRNMLSINGIPRAMVSGDETIRVNPANDRGWSNSPAVVELRVLEAPSFASTVEAVSTNAAVNVQVTSGKHAARTARQRLIS